MEGTRERSSGLGRCFLWVARQSYCRSKEIQRRNLGVKLAVEYWCV